MGPGIIFAVATLALLGFGIASQAKKPAPVDLNALKNKAIDALKSGSADAMNAAAAELEAQGVLAETVSALRAAAAKLEGKPGAAVPGITPPGMSAELKKQIEDLLTKETRPDVLEQVAAALEAKGYTAAALALRAKAKTLKAAAGTADVLTQIVDVLQGKPPGTTPTPPVAPAPPTPGIPTAPPPAAPAPAAPSTYRIKAGDVPYLVAQKFTGNANRWKEIPGANPGMVVKQVKNPKTGAITTLLDPWYAGLTINLPAGWAKPGAPAPAPSPPAPAPGAPPAAPPEPSPGVPGVTPPAGWPAALPYPPPKPSYWPAEVAYPPLAGVKPSFWPDWLAWPPAPPPGWPLTVPFPLPATPLPGTVTPPGATVVGVTYKIKTGDLPYLLAKKWTGDANRWKQLPGANPGMKVVTKAGVTMLQPWYPGLTINIPASWGPAAQAAA